MTAPPRGASPAGKWRLDTFAAATHDGVCALRCDRILWKSTVEPDPDSDDAESEAPRPKARTRVGQFFANFKLQMRYRRSSYSSSTSSEVSNHGHAPSLPPRYEVSTPSNSTPGSQMPTPVGGKYLKPFSRLVTRESSAPGVTRSGSVDDFNVANVKQTPGVDLLRSLSVDRAQLEGKSLLKHRVPSHTEAMPANPKPLSATPLPTEQAPTTTTPKDDQVVKNGPPRWRFLPFFRGDSSQTTIPAGPAEIPGESAEMTTSSTTHRPRKGDVACLGYDSLDDKAMRRLEGRSDHRPVIGSFAIYL